MSRSGALAGLAAAALAALALAGCERSGTTDDEQARSVAETLLAACGQAEPEAALDTLTRAQRRTFVEAGSVIDGCREVLAPLVADAVPDREARDRFAHATVDDVSVLGDSAAVTVSGDAGGTAELELQSKGDLWFLFNPASPAG